MDTALNVLSTYTVAVLLSSVTPLITEVLKPRLTFTVYGNVTESYRLPSTSIYCASCTFEFTVIFFFEPQNIVAHELNANSSIAEIIKLIFDFIFFVYLLNSRVSFYSFKLSFNRYIE